MGLCTDPVERRLSSWKGPFCTSMLVGARVQLFLSRLGDVRLLAVLAPSGHQKAWNCRGQQAPPYALCWGTPSQLGKPKATFLSLGCGKAAGSILWACAWVAFPLGCLFDIHKLTSKSLAGRKVCRIKPLVWAKEPEKASREGSHGLVQSRLPLKLSSQTLSAKTH